MERINSVRKSGLTFAPEAGSQRMRDVINKNVEEAELLHTVDVAFTEGWNRVKLYFMIGLPTETEEDVLAILDLGKKVVDTFYQNKEKPQGQGGGGGPLRRGLCAQALYPLPVVRPGHHGAAAAKAAGPEGEHPQPEGSP